MRRSDSPDTPDLARGWAALARKLGPDLENIPFGRREQKLAQIAEDNGVAANTLRRAVAAESKLELISRRTAVAENALAVLPLVSVEALARWIEFDVSGAKNAAKRAVQGDLGAREVVRKERAARNAAGARKWGTSRKSAAREIVEGLLNKRYPQREALPRVIGRNDAIDFQFTHSGGKVGVLIFGPYQEVTERLIAEFVQRLLGLSLLHHEMLAAVPEKDMPAIKDELNRRFHDFVDREFVRPVARRIKLVGFRDSGSGKNSK